MSSLSFDIGMRFNPEVNPQRLAETLNIIIRELKTKLGAFGDTLDLVDGDSMAKELEKVRAKYEQVASNTQKTGTATDKLVTSLKGATSQAGLLGKAFQFNQITQSISTLTGAIAPFINEFVEFDKQIKNIGTLGVKNFEEYNASLTQLAAKIPGTAADMANATYSAISAGIQGSVEEVTKFVEVAAKAGVAGMSDTSTAVDGLTSVLNAYGLKVSEVGIVADTFFSGIKLGKTTFNEMVSSISSFVPSASALGVGFDQTTAAIARYTAMGTPTAQIGTQMNAVFTLLAKGTSNLNKALAHVGTDLDTLRNKLKLPVEEGGGLVNVMREIKLAAEASGVQIAALTGRVEAAKIIESLAGSQDKYNASLATYNSVLSEIDNNAAEEAFQVAATSIASQTDGYLATIQGYFNSAFQAMGSGATTTLATLTQLSPAITGMAGLVTLAGSSFASLGKSMIGVAGSGSQLVTNILGKYIPALATKNTAEGASTVSSSILGRAFQTMWASALGPIALVLGGIAAVGTAIYFLSDALFESTEEKLENAKADQEMIAGQQKVNEAEQEAITSKQKLIAEYERLNSKTNLTAQEQQKLSDTIAQLNGIYPGAISSTKSFEENLRSLNDASTEDVQKLQELQQEMKNLQVEADKATIKRVELEVESNAENLTQDLVDEIDNFTGLDVFSGENVNIVEGMVDSITSATNSGEIQSALVGFQSSLWNNEAFEDMSPESKKQFIENAKKLAEARNAELDEKNRQATEKLNASLTEFAEAGVGFDDLTIDQKAKIELDAQASGKTLDDVKKMLDDAEKVVRDKKLGEILSESTSINNKLKGVDSLDALVDAFNSAETEIQKAAIGEKIKQIAPEAVQATGVIENANGELVTSYNLLGDKLTESAEKQRELNSAKLNDNQGEYLKSIVEEGNKYGENQEKLDKLQNQISEKVKMGADSSELEQQYNKLKSENDGLFKDIGGMAEKWKSAGLSTEEVFKQISETTNLPIDKVKDLVTEIENSKTAVEDTEEAVKSLGEQFTEGLESAKSNFSNNIPELAALYKQLKEAQASGDKDAIRAAKEQYNQQLQITKQANAEYKAYADSEKAVKELFEEKKKTVKLVTQFEAASKQFKYEEQSLKNSIDQFQIEQATTIAMEERKKTTEDDLVLKQKQIENLEEQRKKYLEIFKISESETGQIDIGIRVKEEQANEIRQKIKEFDNQIAKEKTSVITLNSTIKIEEQELKKKVEETERKNLEFQIELGLRPRFDLVEALNKDLGIVKKQIEEKTNKIGEFQLSGDITAEQSAQLRLLQTQIEDLKKKEIDLNKNVRSELISIYDSELSDLKTKHENELTEIENRLEEEARLRDIILSTTSNLATDTQNKDFENQLARLDRLKEAKLLSEENFNKRREELELDHQKRLQVIQEMSVGEQLEAERQADLERLNQKKSQLVAELEIEKQKADATGNTERFNELSQNISKLEGQIAEKSDIITSLAGNLQGNVTEIFASLTGDEEQMKAPWRKAFSVVAGALKQLASATVTNLLLGQLGIAGATTGLAGLLLVPAIKGLVNAGVNAIFNPILGNLLSFHTGGRVDEPTIAWVGDASKARPGSNTEWIFRDDQIRLLIESVVNRYQDKIISAFHNYSKETNNEVLTELISKVSLALEKQERLIDKQFLNSNIEKTFSTDKNSLSDYRQSKEMFEASKQIEFYNYVKDIVGTQNKELFNYVTEKQSEIISNIDDKEYRNVELSKYSELLYALRQTHILTNNVNTETQEKVIELQNRAIELFNNNNNISEIRKEIKEIFNQNTESIKSIEDKKERFQINKYMDIIDRRSTETQEYKAVEYLLKNMLEKEYNFVNMVKEIGNKTTEKALKSTINNEALKEISKEISKEFTATEITKHFKQDFVKSISQVTSELHIIKQQFKENTFTYENFKDYIKNYSNIKNTKDEYFSNNVSLDKYREEQHKTVLQVKSYATGSGFLDTPELAIIGDAGKNNPEIVLNSPQLEEIMRRATSASNEVLNKKLDEVIGAIENLELVVGDEAIERSKNRYKAVKRKLERTK